MTTPNSPAPRCKHDVHGTDCFECYPAPSGEDEADAEVYCETNFGNMADKFYAFLAGRKGMVSHSVLQAEVERLKADLKGLINQIQIRDAEIEKLKAQVAHTILDNNYTVAEAVRAERERCAAIAAEHHILLGDAGADQIHRRILNPPEAE